MPIDIRKPLKKLLPHLLKASEPPEFVCNEVQWISSRVAVKTAGSGQV